jgi:hypothetical protein
MGYFIDTILSKKLSIEEKIARLEFAYTFDWEVKMTEERWEQICRVELDLYTFDRIWSGSFYRLPEAGRFGDYFGPNERGRCNWPTLAAAVEIGDLTIAEWLLEHGAEVNRGNGDNPSNGKTAIFIAAQQGNLPMFKLLYEKGADLLHKTSQKEKGIALLEHAIQHRQPEILAFMLSCPEINRFENEGCIQDAIPLTKALRANVKHEEERDTLTKIIKHLEVCHDSLNEQKKHRERQRNNAATKIQAAFRGHYIQTAYQAYINRPSIDCLIEHNDFKKAEKALVDIKEQKKILGISNKVRFKASFDG